MKARMIRTIIAVTAAGLVTFGCSNTGNVSTNTDETAEAEVNESADEAEDEPAPGDIDDSDYPSDFLQEQSGKITFDDYDDAIANLKEGQGYAYVDAYGYDGKMLAVTEKVFQADNSSCDASIYALDDGVVRFLGVVSGNGSAYPLRVGDGLIYCGDNHTYESDYLAGSDGKPGIMVKDYIHDGINSDGEFSGFLRKENNFDNDEDFTGGQEEFDAFIAERESKPVLEFTVVGDGTDAEGVTSPFIKDEELYKDILAGASKDDYYAFANMDEDFDVLLIAKKDVTFEGDEADHYATEATIYGPDADGNIVEYGKVESGTTALPISIKDNTIFTGNHTELYKTTLNKEKGTIDTAASEEFDDLDDEVIEIYFFPISELNEE